MKMIITRTSDYEDRETKEFASLQELMDFVNKVGQSILIPPHPYGNDDWELEIYDTYRE